MPTIFPGSAAAFSLVIKSDGVPLTLSAAVTVRVMSMAGVELVPPKAAAMAAGVVPVALTEAETSAVPIGVAMLVVAGSFGVRRFELSCESLTVAVKSALFVRDVVVEKIRNDRLTMLAASILPGVRMTDDYIWDKVRAAESEISHELRVPLTPTAFFAQAPTQAEIDALNGAPWAIDPGYDYDAAAFQYNDKWGFLRLRNKPLHSVSRVRFAYPGGPTAYYDLPLDWLKMDKKYGHIQFVPSTTAFAAPLNAFVMQAIGAGRTIPLAIQINYVAGLENVQANYPELIDVIIKTAAIKIIEDAYLPQSGSISADGLSQSSSVDVSKYHESIDRIMNGGKGSNGGLVTAIHGVRVAALGG